MFIGIILFVACGMVYSKTPPINDLETARTKGLEKHNAYRLNHKVANLTLNTTLNIIAQNYAEYLANYGLFQHSNAALNGRYGENLYQTCLYPNSPSVNTSAEIASNAWYNEITSYNYAKPGFSSITGHFTAMVWKNTTDVGFGIATGTTYSGSFVFVCVYVVANYLPPGNVYGEFSTQVLPPIKNMVG